VPLVITAGHQDNRLLLKDPHLAGDMVGMAKVFTKWCAEAVYVEEIPVLIQRAFKMAMQHPAGPVFVSLPQNVLDQSIDFEYIPDNPPFTDLYPDRKAVSEAVELLVKAERPVILVQEGIARSGALPEVVKLAELIGARVSQPWMADVNFPVQHPQYMGDTDPSLPRNREMLESADVLMWIGCPQTTPRSYQPAPISAERTKMIQLDDNPWEIAKNFPVTVGIQGNIKVSLSELISLLEENMSAKAKEAAKIRVNEIAAEKEAIVADFRRQDDAERDNVPISSSRLMRELADAIKPGTVIVDDCWSSSGDMRRILDLAEPKGFQRARRGGSIGWGLPGALGVKLGAPDRPVVAVSGDGSALWSVQSLWTAAHYNIPVTFIITANTNYRQVKLMRQRALGEGSLTEKHAGMDLDDPIIGFCQLAEAMGVRGDRVERPDDLRATLKDAFDAEEPRLVEVNVENKETP